METSRKQILMPRNLSAASPQTMGSLAFVLMPTAHTGVRRSSPNLTNSLPSTVRNEANSPLVQVWNGAGVNSGAAIEPNSHYAASGLRVSVNTIAAAPVWDTQQLESLPSAGISPEMAIRQFKNKRTAHKLTEILNYPNIYFVGHNADKRQVVPGSEQNYGFDDDQGSYIHTPHDYVAYNFEVLKNLGKGSFGQVVKAFDQMTSTFVGLKMVRNERREIRTSELLRGQDLDNSRNVVHLLKQFTFREHTKNSQLPAAAVAAVSRLPLDAAVPTGIEGMRSKQKRRRLSSTTQVITSNRMISAASTDQHQAGKAPDLKRP
ncbi:unnamed protein product, partial [Mesocestoides corti]